MDVPVPDILSINGIISSVAFCVCLSHLAYVFKLHLACSMSVLCASSWLSNIPVNGDTSSFAYPFSQLSFDENAKETKLGKGRVVHHVVLGHLSVPSLKRKTSLSPWHTWYTKNSACSRDPNTKPRTITLPKETGQNRHHPGVDGDSWTQKARAMKENNWRAGVLPDETRALPKTPLRTASRRLREESECTDLTWPNNCIQKRENSVRKQRARVLFNGQKIQIDSSWKKSMNNQISTWKDMGKCKLKLWRTLKN